MVKFTSDLTTQKDLNYKNFKSFIQIVFLFYYFPFFQYPTSVGDFAPPTLMQIIKCFFCNGFHICLLAIHNFKNVFNPPR